MKYPTLKAFQSMALAADSTDDAQRDCTQLDKHLSNFARQNGRIRGNIRKRRAAVASWGWQIVPNDPAGAEEAAAATLRLASAIDAVINAVCEYSLYSRFVIQLNWADVVSETGISYRKPVPVKLRPHQSDSREDGFVQLMPTRKVIQPDDQNYVWAVDEPDARSGDMLAIGEMEIMRRDMVIEWANYNRKLKGIIQGIDLGTSDDERKVAEEAMANAINHNFVLTDEFVKFNFAQLVAAGGGESFKLLADELRTAITVAILGEANTTELVQNGGSRAAVQIQAQIGADIMWTDINLANEVINSQLLVHDRMVNYQSNVLPYRFRMTVDEATDREANVVVAREALTAGIPLVKAEVYRNIGYSQPATGDEVFESAPTGFGGA